jgi:hypothetical protein
MSLLRSVIVIMLAVSGASCALRSADLPATIADSAVVFTTATDLHSTHMALRTGAQTPGWSVWEINPLNRHPVARYGVRSGSAALVIGTARAADRRGDRVTAWALRLTYVGVHALISAHNYRVAREVGGGR